MQQALGLAPHSPQPTGGHGLAWELRIRAGPVGTGTLGWKAAAKRREKGGPRRKCLSAAGRAGAIGTRGTSGSGLAFATAVGT